MKRKETAIKLISEKYGESLLAIYERGSALYGLELTMSDYDLMVIIRSRKEELITESLFAESVKLYEGETEFDLLVMSEYRFFSSLKKCTLTHTECLLKEPIYVAPEYAESAEFLGKYAYELLTMYPSVFAGALFGYGMSYSSKKPIEIGEFEGKKYGMSYKFSRVVTAYLEGKLTKETFPELVTPLGEARERIVREKGMTELTSESEVAFYEKFKEEYEGKLREVKELVKTAPLESPEKVKLFETYYEMLLPLI